jgi:acetolactate synthase regulatory subunit
MHNEAIELSDALDHVDLMMDEFERIKALVTNYPGFPVSSEIQTLCDRAINNTKQKVPVIRQLSTLTAKLEKANDCEGECGDCLACTRHALKQVLESYSATKAKLEKARKALERIKEVEMHRTFSCAKSEFDSTCSVCIASTTLDETK